MGWLLAFVVFGLLGMGAEAFFTGLAPLVRFVLYKITDGMGALVKDRCGISARTTPLVSDRVQESISALRFEGRVWIGMALVYGFGALPFDALYGTIHDFHIAIRVLLYGAAIMGYEFVSGIFIVYGWRLISGETFYPWYYAKPGHIMHLIYRPYFKYWCLLGLLLEYVYSKLI